MWRHPLADVAAKAAAPLGAVFTLLGLVTGSLWGKPMWGAWWVWDARLTSFLLLLFLYLGYIALWNAIEDEVRAARVAAVLALVGAVNLPIIEFSVDWWTTLHQGESILRAGGPQIAGRVPVAAAAERRRLHAAVLHPVDHPHTDRDPGAPRPFAAAGGRRMSGFLAMGGYAAYVWPAYGATVVLLGAAVALTWRAYVRARTRLAALERP